MIANLPLPDGRHGWTHCRQPWAVTVVREMMLERVPLAKAPLPHAQIENGLHADYKPVELCLLPPLAHLKNHWEAPARVFLIFLSHF